MGILLFILKVILIVFLAVIGLTVLLLAVVLLVPIHYEVSGEIKDSFQFDVKGTVKYCFSMLKVVICYQEGQMKTELFFFGRQKKKKEQEFEESAETEQIESEEAEDLPAEERTDLETEHESSEETVAALESETEEESAESETKTKKKRKKKKRKTEDAVSADGLEEKKKIDFAFLKQELTDEQNRSVVKKLLGEVKYFFHHFKFRKIKTELLFSAGNPALTGQLLGVLCMFPTFYRYEIGMTPDFTAEDVYLKGTFLAAGRVRLIHILIVGLRLIFDKEVRIVIKKIMALAT